MSIFISYASVDRERARLVAKALEHRGWSVWWDRTIPPGKEYDQVIEEALDSAKCVVVLWSRASVASTWVKTESAEAMRRKILVPALIDEVKIPLEFRRLQAADLSHWRGEANSPDLAEFFQSIDANIRGTADTGRDKDPVAPPPPPAPALVAKPRLARRYVWAAAGLIVMVVAAALSVTLWQRPEPTNAGVSSTQEARTLATPTPVLTAPPSGPTGSAGQPPAASGAVVTQPIKRAAPPAPTTPTPVGSTASKPAPIATPTAAPAQVTTSPSPTSGSPSPPPVVPIEPSASSPAGPQLKGEVAVTSVVASTPPASVPASAPAPSRPVFPTRQFAVVLQTINTDGEAEEIDALLVFEGTSLVVKDEDANTVRTLQYTGGHKATYRRTERRIWPVTITRHWLTLGSGREEIVVLIPGDTHQSILSEVEQRFGTTVRRVD